MKQELEEQLYNKYPKLFKQRKLPMTQTAMCFGLECGSGWFDIVDRMCSLIQGHIDQSRSSAFYAKEYNRVLRQAINGNDRNLRFRYKKFGHKDEVIEEYVKRDIENKPFRQPFREVAPQVEFTQIKEKFGTLRAYITGGDEYCHGIISMAVSMSAITCEECGMPGKQRGGGWIMTLCDNCEEARKTRKFK
ncbi:MAG: hypothetical protein EBZ58_07930 [Bacteroidetes bacterium]|nr:hypothetical protein [Bacteroidota bacterium]